MRVAFACAALGKSIRRIPSRTVALTLLASTSLGKLTTRKIWSARHSQWSFLAFFSSLISRRPAMIKTLGFDLDLQVLCAETRNLGQYSQGFVRLRHLQLDGV